MVKLIGLFLVATSVLSLIFLPFLSSNESNQLTGNVVSNIIGQPSTDFGFFDYIDGIVLSFSILSMIIGLIFLLRV